MVEGKVVTDCMIHTMEVEPEEARRYLSAPLPERAATQAHRRPSAPPPKRAAAQARRHPSAGSALREYAQPPTLSPLRRR